MSKFTVAIIGAGLNGLLLAIALEKYAPDVDFQVYEATSELTTAGVGITVQPRTWFVLEELGLAPALLKFVGNGEKTRIGRLYRKSDEPEGLTFNEGGPNDDSFTIHRGELQKAYMEHIRSPERIHLGKRFASYSQPADSAKPLEIRFEDGSTTTCDLLIGCDGIKSSVRAVMYTQLADAAQKEGRNDDADRLRSCIPAVYAGQSVYRGLFERGPVEEGKPPELNRSHLVIYCGKDRHLVSYPIQHGRILNVAAVIAYPELEGTVYEGPWTEQILSEDVRKVFVGWEPEVEDIMQKMDSWSKWALNVVKPLPTYVDGRVVLLGDAAHAMTPHQGAGAGQGFEDCMMLGQLLGQREVNTNTIPVALQVYDQFRRPFSQAVADYSNQSGQLHSFVAPGLENLTVEMSAAGEGPSIVQLEKLASMIEGLKEWRRDTTILKDCQAAQEILRELLVAPTAGPKPEA